MGNQKTKQSQTSSSSTSLNDWSKNLFEGGMSGVMGTIDKFNTNSPFKPYTGSMVADLSGGEQQARQYASTNLGSTAGMFGDAENAIKTGMASEWNPEQVSYRQYNSGDEAKFMNPYKSQVVEATGAYIEEERDRQMMANQARATQSGAFGGSRHGVADGELMRTAAMDKAGMLADLNYRGFNDSMDRFERESGALYGANTYNAGRNDSAAQYRADQQFRGAGMLGDLAGQKQDSWMRETQMMNQLGMDERAIEDAKLLAERAKYDDQAADEWRRMQLELQTRIGLLGATPLLTNTQGTGSTTSSQSGMNFAQIGGLLSGVGALSGFK
jgi:hypothetical protein